MSILPDLHSDLTRRTDAIVIAFNLATERDPWRRLPEPERINFLRNLIRPLAEVAASDPVDAAVCRRVLHIAARHGERRRQLELPVQILFDDVYYFRYAVCSQIDYDGSADAYTAAVTRVDQVLSVVTLATLRGYYRDEFEARGEWPDTLEALVREMSGVERRGEATSGLFQERGR
ncbi:MAG: hypothetical protein WD737_03585 [Gemmatimonadota bacterium]